MGSVETPVANGNGADSGSFDWFDDAEHIDMIFSNKKRASKTFCDPVHEHIELHPVCVAIVDTPQFQRLRHIKQTGLLDYVYPGATHNRFGHSLGVCYLAGEFLQELRYRQPELSISNVDVLCVSIAGLCHDLGHGPYSHTWELFMKNSQQKHPDRKWKHELVSTKMLDYLIEENNLGPFLKSYGIEENEIKLIKDYILGSPPKNDENAFLYQIVNNEASGLDVDKWDYFLRDCRYLGLPCSFEYKRLIKFAKVLKVNGRNEICFRDKVFDSVWNVFRTRYNLHRLAYQHRVATVAEYMFQEALVLADGNVNGPSGEVLKLSKWSFSAAFAQGNELRHALQKYCMLTDSFLHTCLAYSSTNKRVAKLVKAIEKRSCITSGCYKHIGLKTFFSPCNEEQILTELCQYLPSANEVVSSFMAHAYKIPPVTQKDICISVVHIHWGKGPRNPVQFVHFYSKDSPIGIKSLDKLEVSAQLPKSFEEFQVHVLCRRNDQYAFEVLSTCLEKYWPDLSSSCVMMDV